MPSNSPLLKNALALVIAACTRADVAERPDSGVTADPVVTAKIDSDAIKLQPRDEANESFRQFRTQLLDALSRKDTTFVYGILDPVIKNSFGGDEGIDGFKRLWEMDSATTPMWTALTRVLSLGGEQSDDSIFVAPYVFAFWPDSLDSFEHVAVIGSSVKVYEQPLPDARALGTVDHSILRLRAWKGLASDGIPADTIWANVQLPNGVQGWLRSADIYSPAGWRAMFVRQGGRWRMTFFVAGD
jgi:hypothetical protein